MKKINIRTIFFIILFIMVIIMYNLIPYDDSFKTLKTEVMVSIIVVCYCIYYEIKLFKKFNLYIIYIILVYLINAGQALAIVWGEPINSFASYKYGGYSYDSIIYALRFITLTVFALCIGGGINCNKSKVDKMNNKRLDVNSLYIVGLILSLIAVPIDLYLKVKAATQSIQYGYLYGFQNAYEFKDIGSVLGSVSLFCIPGCFLLSYAMLKKKSKFKYCPIIYLIIRSNIDLLCGSRGNAIAILIAVVYFINNYFYQPKKKNIKKFIVLILGGYLLSCIFMAVYDWRIIESRNLTVLLKEIFRNIFEGGIFRGMFKSLSVEYPLYEVIKNVKNGNYTLKYGMTYIYSVIMIIPSFIRGGLYTVGHEHGWIGIENDLTNSVNLRYGIGYTNLAELYLNFGINGIIIMILYGYIISKLIIINNNEKNETKVPMKVAIFSILILAIRSTMQLFYKYCFYYYLIPLVLIRIFSQSTDNNKKELNLGGKNYK